MGEAVGVGRRGALLALQAHGSGVLAGCREGRRRRGLTRGEGAGLGLGERLGERVASESAVEVSGTGRGREGVLGRLAGRLVVRGPAVGAGPAVGTGACEEVHGAVGDGGGIPLGLLGGGHVATFPGQLDRQLSCGGAALGRGASIGGRLIGVAGGGGPEGAEGLEVIRFPGCGGGRGAGIGRQAHEAVGACGPAGGGGGGGAGGGGTCRRGVEQSRRGGGVGRRAVGL